MPKTTDFQILTHKTTSKSLWSERERWENNWGENFMQCWGKSRGQF